MREKNVDCFSIIMIRSIFIYMKRFLRSAHLNFGNSTNKFLHINQIMLLFFQLGAVPEYLCFVTEKQQC